MEKLKSNLTNMVGVLTGVALICGGLLAYVNKATEEPRKIAAQNALKAGIEQVMCGKCDVQKVDTVTRNVDGKDLKYIVYNTNKGTAVQSTDPNGFGGNLTILVGFNETGNILGYTVLETTETPGLGAKADKWFQGDGGQGANIIGKNPSEGNFTVSKDGGDIDAITASTITSRSFLRAVVQAYNTFKGNNEADANTGATKQANCSKDGECCKDNAADDGECCKDKASKEGECCKEDASKK